MRNGPLPVGMTTHRYKKFDQLNRLVPKFFSNTPKSLRLSSEQLLNYKFIGIKLSFALLFHNEYSPARSAGATVLTRVAVAAYRNQVIFKIKKISWRF